MRGVTRVFLMKPQTRTMPAGRKEQDAGGAPTREVRTQLVQPFPERPRERHADRPAILESLEVGADHHAIPLRETSQPLADRLTARPGAEEESPEAAKVDPPVPKKVLERGAPVKRAS